MPILTGVPSKSSPARVKLVNTIVSPSGSEAAICFELDPSFSSSLNPDNVWLLIVGITLSVTFIVIGSFTIASVSWPATKCSSEADIEKLYDEVDSKSKDPVACAIDT